MASCSVILVLVLVGIQQYSARRDSFQLQKDTRPEDYDFGKFFDQDDHIFEVIEGDEVKLARTYYTNGDIRLKSNDEVVAGETLTSGRLELYVHTLLEGSGESFGTWGTICGEGFSMSEANVACRQLGYSHALNWTLSSKTTFGKANESAPIFLEGVKCSRSDLSHIMRCRPSSESTIDCSHDSDIALFCASNAVWNTPYKGQVRLVNYNSTSVSPSSGRVEVYQGQAWGTVCNREFNQAAADTVCRQLGYTNAIAIFNALPGEGVIWVEDITCDASASCFKSCFKNHQWANTCNHTLDVAIHCTYDVSLAQENGAGNEGMCSIGVFPVLAVILALLLSVITIGFVSIVIFVGVRYCYIRKIKRSTKRYEELN